MAVEVALEVICQWLIRIPLAERIGGLEARLLRERQEHEDHAGPPARVPQVTLDQFNPTDQSDHSVEK